MGRAFKVEQLRIKESLHLDTVIRDRAHSLFLENDLERLKKKAKCLAAMITCQEEMDEIMAGEPEEVAPTTNIGDIHVNVAGSGGAGSNAPYRPFDGGDIGRQVAKELRKAVV